MKNIKFKRRIDSAVDAFFAGESSNENGSMTFTNYSSLSANKTETLFTQKGDKLLNALKQTFLFFPGTFVLFIISFAFSVISVNNPFHASISSEKIFSVCFWFAAAVFMTWYGIGDLRKPKHFVIPVSIISTGIVLGIFSGIASALFYQFQHFVWSNAFPLCFFPLALIVPFLAKGLVDRKQEN